MKIRTLSVIAFASGMIFLSACGGEGNSTYETDKDTITEVAKEKENTATEKKDDGSFKGTLKSVMDTGLPGIWNVVVTDSEGKETYFNYETGGPGETPFPELIGKSVAITYDSKSETMAADIVVEGKSILGEWGGINQNKGEINPEWKTFEGVMNAPTETGGDLPDMVTVKSSDGKELKFEAFVTAEHVSAHGKNVKVYYSEHTRKTATAVKAN